MLITFLITLAASFAIIWLASRPQVSEKLLQARISVIQGEATLKENPAAARIKLIERFGTWLSRFNFSTRLQTLILHGGAATTPAAVAVTSISLALITGIIARLFLPSFIAVAIVMLAAAAAPIVRLRIKRARRLKQFDNALPTAIELLTRALRAGHSIISAIEMIAEQSSGPLATEFAAVFQQQKFGIPFRDALLEMGDRVPSRDLHFLITAVLVQRETGGDLTEILDRAAAVIRERISIQGEVRVHTAQGRLTGWILGALPIVMLVLLNFVSPGYSSILFHDPLGQKLLYAGATLIIVGGLIIRKVVDIKV